MQRSGGPERVIDDFKFGFCDWYTLNGNHRPLWQHWTRRVTDPKWRGPKGAKLALTIQSEQPNVLGIVLHENTWRSYRGKRRTYVTEVKFKGSKPETVTVGLSDFKNVTDGVPLKSWGNWMNLASWLRPRFAGRNRWKWRRILGRDHGRFSSSWSGCCRHRHDDRNN